MISELCIRRPIGTCLVFAAIVLYGVFSYFQLPVSELPDIDFPTLVVNADLPGADPETMATAVATPLEKQLSTISGIEDMTSQSEMGSTQIVIQFDLARNIDAAAQDVQAAILQAMRYLPREMPSPPIVRKMNPADAPIMYLALSAGREPLTQLNEFAQQVISPELSSVPGLAQLRVFGGQEYAVRIQLNPYALANRGLDPSTITTAIAAANTHQPSGTLESEGMAQLIKLEGGLFKAKEFGHIVISGGGTRPVYLKDVATVQDSVLEDKAQTYFNQRRAIVMAIEREPGSNTVQVARAVRNVLNNLTAQLPADVKLAVAYDRSWFIEASLHEVLYTLLFATVLVVGVIFVFLGSLRSTFIAAVSLPISILGTFACMTFFGFSLDNLSLMGLVLAIGFVIDDAVVVLENITRHLEQGLTRFQAALLGSREILFTILSMTLSLIAVFIPLFLMGGIMGELFYEFAVVVTLAIGISGVLSLTLTPMLSSQWLSAEKSPSRWAHGWELKFAAITQAYERTLTLVLRHIKWVLAFSGLILILSAVIFVVMPKDFIPQEDSGIIFGNIESFEGDTFDSFKEKQLAAEKLILQNPSVLSVISNIGEGSSSGSNQNSGFFVIQLKPLSERSMKAPEVVSQLREVVSQVSGVSVSLNSPPSIRMGGKSASGSVQYILEGVNWDLLKKTAKSLKGKLVKLPGIQDVDSDLEDSSPELRLHILRNKAAAMGISPDQIAQTLFDAYGEHAVSTILNASGDYSVLMEVAPEYQKDEGDLGLLKIRSASGNMVPLLSLVQVERDAAPLSINHFRQLTAVTFSFNLEKDASLSAVTQAVNELAENQLPIGISGHFGGNAKTFQESMKSLPILFGVTVLTIYVILGLLYEDFVYPLVILTALPFAIFGALLALWICHRSLNLFSFIGLIMLVGLTKKNGIMMVDFALTVKRESGLSAREAIVRASVVRFRPIMMTTVAAIVATLPLAFGLGAGGETRSAMGIAVVGGLLFSQLITLYVTPAFFVWMSPWAERVLKVASRVSG